MKGANQTNNWGVIIMGATLELRRKTGNDQAKGGGGAAPRERKASPSRRDIFLASHRDL